MLSCYKLILPFCHIIIVSPIKKNYLHLIIILIYLFLYIPTFSTGCIQEVEEDTSPLLSFLNPIVMIWNKKLLKKFC